MAFNSRDESARLVGAGKVAEGVAPVHPNGCVSANAPKHRSNCRRWDDMDDGRHGSVFSCRLKAPTLTQLFFGLALVITLLGQPAAVAAEFEVRAGYLSSGVRDLVQGHGWSLVWAADEDRIVDYQFSVTNDSLRGALTDLLEIYRGQFVADLFEGNRVVLVDSPPPRVRVVLPVEGIEIPNSGGVELSSSAPALEPSAALARDVVALVDGGAFDIAVESELVGDEVELADNAKPAD